MKLTGLTRGLIHVVAPRGHFSDNGLCQLRPGHFRVRVVVASRGHFSGRPPCHSGLPQVSFQKILLTKWYDGVVLAQNVNTT